MRKRDLLADAALVMAVVGTATAEYDLAVASGWGRVAFALPGALDVYAVRAMRAHRDVVLMAAVMFGVNALSHLVSAGLLPASWPVVVAVSALPILVLVRVHAIREEPTPTPTPTGVAVRGVAAGEGGGNSDSDSDSDRSRSGSEVPAEPDTAALDVIQGSAPVPVTLERVPDSEGAGANLAPALSFGPFVPVAELLAGTSRDQGRPVPYRRTELDSEPVEPEPEVPEPEAEPQPEPIEVPPGVSVEHVTLVTLWLKANPKLTGTEIGTRLGTSDSYGRRVRRAALAVPA